MVLAVFDFPDNDVLDQVMNNLPMFRSMGSALKVELWPARPYEHFIEELRQAVEDTGAPAG